MLRRQAVAVVAVLALFAACTTDDPPPSDPGPTESVEDDAPAVTGDRVAIVLAPPTLVASGETAALQQAADRLVADPPDGVRALRVVQATTEAFARDLVELAVDDGFDLVCLVGTGVAPVVLELARARRDARFCTTDPRVGGGPVNLVAVAPDTQQLVEVGAVAIGQAPAPVGLLLSEQAGDVAALIATFTSAVATPQQPEPSPSPSPSAPPTAPASPTPSASPASPPPATGTETETATETATETETETEAAAAAAVAAFAAPTSTPSPAPTASPSPPTAPTPVPAAPQPTVVTLDAGARPQAQRSSADQLASAGASRALVMVAPAGNDSAAVVAAGGTELVVLSAWAVDAEGQLPGSLLAALTVDWGMVLQRAVLAGLDEEASQVTLVGAADGALGAVAGQLADGEAAAGRATARLEELAVAAEES